MPSQPPVSCWLSCHRFGTALPINTRLQDLLSELLHKPSAMLEKNQLSVLYPGYHHERQNRHVDGAQHGIFWHALLVGVLLDELPSDRIDRGNPLVWPGSHLTTQAELSQLGPNPTREKVRDTIDGITRKTVDDGVPISGAPGTMFLMDHALVHGMADQTIQGFERRVAYYRIGNRTEEPSEVVDRRHFFK